MEHGAWSMGTRCEPDEHEPAKFDRRVRRSCPARTMNDRPIRSGPVRLYEPDLETSDTTSPEPSSWRH